MASFASEVYGTQMVEFFNRFGRFGGSIAKLQRLLGNDETMKRWVKQLDEFPEFRLIHGVFTPQSDVLAAFKSRCAVKGIDFSKFEWIGPAPSPLSFTDDPEVAVVLDATLGTLQQTFEFAWEWTVDGQDAKWRWEGMDSDPEKLVLLDGLEFRPWTLRWVRIKLDANVGRKPTDVRNAETSPGCALLFMGAEHPERIKATDYKKRFGFWLAGLKCTAPGGELFRNVPYASFHRGTRQVGLDSHWGDISGPGLAVPVLVE